MNALNAINKGHIAKEWPLIEPEKLKPKPVINIKSKPKSPFYFNPKSENRKLAQLVEAIVMSEPETSKSEKWSFKIVGFQLKNEDKVAVDNWTSKDSISGDINKYSKNILLKNSPFLSKWHQFKKPTKDP